MTDFIAPYLAHLRASGMSELTILERGRYLRRIDNELPCGLNYASTEELENELAQIDPKTREARYGRQTQANYRDHIVGFFAFACDPSRSHGLNYNPAEGLRRARVPEREPTPCSTEQLTHARAHLPNPWRLYAELAAFAGLRAVEISRLNREDVSKDLIHVRRGKGDRARTVETNPELWRAIQVLPRGPIARTVRGDRATAHYVSTVAGVKFDEIGLPDVSLHRCRSWYATYLLDLGVPVTAVQRAMGHSSLKTTAMYLAVTPGQRAKLRSAVHALSGLAPTPS